MCCQTIIDGNDGIWPKLSAQPGSLKFFFGTPPFSDAKHPKGCWSVITTLSFRIARRWSLEGVSLLLGCSLWRKTTGGVSRGSAPTEWECLNSSQAVWALIISPSLIPPSVAPQAQLWWTGTFSEGSLAWKKRKKNHQRESSSSFILSLHMDCVQAERQNCLAHESHL